IVITGVMQMRTMNAATANVDRPSRNIESSLRILDGCNSSRRFQLSSLASTGADRTKELDRVNAMGKALAKDAEELEKIQRGADNKKLAGDMRGADTDSPAGNAA